MISLDVLAVILVGAFCHAAWNAVVKRGSDTFLSAVLVGLGCGGMAAVALPFLRQPDAASWPFIAGSVLAQVLYTGLLAAAYAAGDMSHTYPLMRGAAPLMVALASGPVLAEGLSAGRWAGIGFISLGVLGMGLGGQQGARRSPTALAFALLNAGVIATYTLIDGLGVRRSGAPIAYAFWTFALTAVPLFGWALVRRRLGVAASYARTHWPVAVVGGTGTLTSYTLALWAMAVAPVAAVAALRESAILFGTAISVLVLKERVTPSRLVATLVILAGVGVVKAF